MLPQWFPILPDSPTKHLLTLRPRLQHKHLPFKVNLHPSLNPPSQVHNQIIQRPGQPITNKFINNNNSSNSDRQRHLHHLPVLSLTTQKLGKNILSNKRTRHQEAPQAPPLQLLRPQQRPRVDNQIIRLRGRSTIKLWDNISSTTSKIAAR